jgi:hypothetical protein
MKVIENVLIECLTSCLVDDMKATKLQEGMLPPLVVRVIFETFHDFFDFFSRFFRVRPGAGSGLTH